jgi:hypothetical protein
MEERVMRPNETEVIGRTRALLEGRLKHVRTAGLAAALVPLAAVAASTASPEACPSAGVCGIVWLDTNRNGVQDPGEVGILDAVVSANGMTRGTDENGFYHFDLPAGTYNVEVQIPPGMQTSPPNVGDDATDSDGVPDGAGNSVAMVTLTETRPEAPHTDFGLWVPPVEQPGTGTPGYWKNHPEAWPVESITVGGVTYSKAQALAWLDAVGKDRTTTMFSSLVPAKLNVLIGNDSSCVANAITAADEWMQTYGLVGSGVHAASVAWKIGEPLHRQLDNYNNGMLCAPHRE